MVGVADTLVISYAGEAAVSGVSLVNQFNTIFVYLFSALASGGAVVTSQYIGSGDSGRASKSSSQLLMFSAVFSVAVSVLVLIANRSLLGLLFGSVDWDVMEAGVTYLRISAYSYPMLAIYNAGSALYRSTGDTKTTMYISVAANVVNIIGNCVGVFLLKAGVAGVAWPSFISRTMSAAWITILCFKKSRAVRYEAKWIFHSDWAMLKRILGIAVPSGVENGVFQLIKVALTGIVALFGTSQIAANGVAQSVYSLASLAGVSMGPVFITVIGQCMGRSDTDMAEHYFSKLLKITLVGSAVWNLLILALTPLFLQFYALEPETRSLAFRLIALHNIFNTVVFPFSGALGNGLRAAGDVKFTMIATIVTTIFVRLLLSWLLAVTLGMGVMGTAWAMCADWAARGAMQYIRLKRGKWKQFKVI
jgi:putative MATE family efflux protein